MRFVEWQDRRKYESDNGGICRNGNLCDCRLNDGGSILAVVNKSKWILRRRGKMRTLWNEYGGVILGITGAVAITGVVVCMLLPKGSIYEIMMAFSRSIC